jgi:hypothetical protein
VAVLRPHAGSSYHVTNTPYSSRGGWRITQMSDLCCYLAGTSQYLRACKSCRLRKGAAYSPKCVE